MTIEVRASVCRQCCCMTGSVADPFRERLRAVPARRQLVTIWP
jgi:hypothetical protein